MTTIRSLHRFRGSACSLGLLALAALLLTAGCDSNEPAEDETVITDVRMIPDEATIELGNSAEVHFARAVGSVDFSVVGLTASGEEVPLPEDAETKWWSTDPSVFTVQGDGTATGQGPGEAFCVIEMRRPPAGGIVVVTWDSARVAVF